MTTASAEYFENQIVAAETKTWGSCAICVVGGYYLCVALRL
jgi:hypothetical protein